MAEDQAAQADAPKAAPEGTAAERIAAFAVGLRGAGVPEPVLHAATLHLLDAVGVGLAASAAPHCAGWAGAAEPGAVPLLSGGTASPGSAAMLNGALIHALEYDDTHTGSVVHGSAVAAPAALAAGAEAGATGREALLASVLAWEVAVRIGRAAPGAFQARGFQATTVGGAVGAAAASAFLRGLDPVRIVSALGIAGSEASGTLAFLSDGATVKALNPGWAARTGLTAARLAEVGMTGPADILEGRFGVMAAFAGIEDGLGTELSDLGDRWHLPDAAFKLWPCCHYIHPFLEALGGLVREGLAAPDILSLTVHVPPPMVPLICEPWARRQAPATGYDGKWGLPWCLAVLLTDGAVTVESFEAAPRAEVTALARRMEWVAMAGHGFPDRFAARIEVETVSGRHVAEVASVLGGPGRPVPDEAIRAKFRANAARRLPPPSVDRLEAALLGLAEAPDLSELTAALG
ncbi:MmgE/PrpD family protein [Rhodovulum sp. 12E13]|uniref:MmgE/PrpD family protein n=1 Tax=Rhodovulum sp. 12E13 TaxID=2203891 RepID=UPI000E194FA9|nr:MmgE/PrpD family protein [Rhodovulum sp. 12E13]RDC75228.1 MmgE/PrpD family protein [Rhodovulum sp. 12E13]